MTARMRILYLAVLAVFFWMFLYVDSWLAAYGLLIVLVMPVLSLLVSLPAMLGCRVRVEGCKGQCCRGEENQWRITVYNTARLPLPRVKVRLTMHQTLTGVDKDHAISPPSGNVERSTSHGYQPLRHLGSRCALGAGV